MLIESGSWCSGPDETFPLRRGGTSPAESAQRDMARPMVAGGELDLRRCREPASAMDRSCAMVLALREPDAGPQRSSQWSFPQVPMTTR